MTSGIANICGIPILCNVELVNMIWLLSRVGRMVKKLCLGVDVAESEDEKFGVVYAVEFSPERLDFRID